jgi:metal-sulfur cluster biosynthetic enzyme
MSEEKKTTEKPKRLEEVKLRLSEVIDPEIGVNIVDLGLIRNITFLSESKIHLLATLTSIACPLTEYIEDSVISALDEYDVEIEWIWEPPWSPEDISKDGQEYLAGIGIEL